MSVAALGITKASTSSKRMRMPDDPGLPNKAVRYTSDATQFDPNDDAIGVNSEAYASITNGTIHVKLIGIPTAFPPNNRFVDTLPIGSIVFTRNHASRTRSRDASFSSESQRRFFKQADRVQCITLEQLNMLLHYETINNHARNAGSATIFDAYQEWHCMGVNGLPPAANQDSLQPYATRPSEERYLDIRPKTEGFVTNYWGETVAGDVNSHLWLLWIEAPITDSTSYVLDADRDVSVTLGNKYLSETMLKETIVEELRLQNPNAPIATLQAQATQQLPLRQTVRTVPRVVARYTQTKYFPLEKKEYCIKLPSPTNPNQLLEHVRYGRAVYVGLCRVNQVFDQKIAKSLTKIEGDARDMHYSCKLPQLWCNVNVTNRFCN